jgi:integrase
LDLQRTFQRITSRARAAFEELLASRGALPLRGEDLVFAPLLDRQRPPVRKMAPDSEFTPRRRAENRLTHQFARVVEGLGMTGVSLHSLRHSCASRMVMAGVPLSAVARVTGHSTLRCAALYGKHAPQDAAKLAIRALEAAAAMPPATAADVPPSAAVARSGSPATPEAALVPASAAGR